ncbi:MAG: hypothetical protein IPO17_15320 [Flavobacteriales bacterium]|nr:hypothetical protein [Flavobacteriales bacterium]
MTLYDSSLRIARTAGDTLSMCVTYNGKGAALLEVGNADGAFAQWQEGIDLHKRWHAPKGDLLPYMATNLAQQLFERGLYLAGDQALADAQAQESISALSTGSHVLITRAKGVREGTLSNSREFLAFAREALRTAQEVLMDQSGPATYLGLVESLTAALHLICAIRK